MKPVFPRWLLAAFALLALAGCGGGTKLQPPAASIQQLQALPSGQWQLTLRVENYSYDTAMHVYTLDAELSVGGATAGHLVASPGLDIPEMSADTATATITPDAAALSALAIAKNNAVAYELKGHLGVGKGEGGGPQPFAIDGKGYLSPVPGVANTWR